MPTTKIYNHLLICMNLYQHVKTHLIPLVYSWDTSKFRAQTPDWPYPFLTMPNRKIFNHLLIFKNSYQLGCFINLLWRNSSFKNHAVWLDASILAFISGTRSFPICAWTQQLIKIFIIERSQWKLNTKFFFKFKKPYFWSISPIFLGKKVFPKNRAVMHNFIRVSGTMPKFREI